MNDLGQRLRAWADSLEREGRGDAPFALRTLANEIDVQKAEWRRQLQQVIEEREEWRALANERRLS